MSAARRDVEVKSRKDESKLQQTEATQEFTRRQHEFLETDIRKVQRYQLLQLGQVEQRQIQEVNMLFSFTNNNNAHMSAFENPLINQWECGSVIGQQLCINVNCD